MTTRIDSKKGAIGIFDSGLGGLTVMRSIVEKLPQYDYLYLGDSARSPYGTRSFDTIYNYTLESVKFLFSQGCPLVILACNTASARALRTIQQQDLPTLQPNNRVLGIIRPTAEVIGEYSSSGHVGILGTNGTINSQSYPLEIKKQFPTLQVYQQACPMWVPLVENGELDNAGAVWFVQRDLERLLSNNPAIDTILLGCTHYPLLLPLIEAQIPTGVRVLSQGAIVAKSLADYLRRHPEMTARLGTTQKRRFLTTGTPRNFSNHASEFYGQTVIAQHVDI